MVVFKLWVTRPFPEEEACFYLRSHCLVLSANDAHSMTGHCLDHVAVENCLAGGAHQPGIAVSMACPMIVYR